MFKRVIAISLLGLSLMFSGCGEEDTTCRIDVQNALDKGEFDKAIDLMNGVCATAFTPSDMSLNMATAYMGKSGYGVSDVADMMLNSSSFSSFTLEVDSKKAPDSLPLLDKADKYFLASIADGNKTTADTLCTSAEINASNDARLSNVCLYVGFNSVIKTTSAITYLTNDIDTLVSSIDSSTQDTTPDDMKASLDALQWAIDANATLDNNSTITANDVNISGKTYTHLNVSTNGKVFYRLAKSSVRDVNNSTLITDGYCDVDGNKTACEGIEYSGTGAIDTSASNAANCYACPLAFDGAAPDVASLLVDALNSGADSIGAVSADADIKQSIDDFKAEITGGSAADVTIADILNYLNQ
jgi:hypothetical protein